MLKLYLNIFLCGVRNQDNWILILLYINIKYFIGQ